MAQIPKVGSRGGEVPKVGDANSRQYVYQSYIKHHLASTITIHYTSWLLLNLLRELWNCIPLAPLI